MDIALAVESIPGISSRLDTRKLVYYIRELLEWNEQLGLVSKRGSLQLALRLIERSVSLWDFTRAGAVFPTKGQPLRIIDIGSGGGFPGIIWKLLDNQMELALLERKSKKASFLQRLVGLLEMTGVEVVEGDLRSWARESAKKFDVAAMMAVSLSEKVAESIELILAPSGYLCTVRGGVEKIFPDMLGKTLRLHRVVADASSVFLLYKRT